MVKIKGWEKYDDYVWRTKVGSGYKYIWIASKNIVRVVDFDDKPKPFPLDLTSKSYVLQMFGTLKDADKFVKKFMRDNPIQNNFEVWFEFNRTGIWYFETIQEAIKFANKYYDNKPIIYHLARDEVVMQYSKDKIRIDQ